MSEKHFPYNGDPEERKALFFVYEGYQEYKQVRTITGFCHCNIHQGYISLNTMKKHNCHIRQCPYFEKFDDFPYWIVQQHKKKEKLEHKNSIRRDKCRTKQACCIMDSELQDRKKEAMRLADILSFSIIITRIFRIDNSTKNDEYIINYVSDNKQNDWKTFFPLALAMREKFGGIYKLRHQKWLNGEYVTKSEWIDYISEI